TYISGRFDSSFHEAHDIAQHIMIHCSVRLEAPVTRESDFFHLERTYSVDTVVYILNRLFRMHNDVLDGGWQVIELTTPDTKSHKIDGIFKAIKTKRENKALIIIECSKGPKTPEQKKYDDHVKLCRNSMRLLNKVLENVPKNYARIYLVQCAGGYIDIKYLVRPLPSVYLLDRFLRIKIPKTFNDFEDFSKGIIDLMNWQTDVLLTVKKINKAFETKNDEIHITPIQDTPQKDKTK
ncbi:13094_t:CDS:2, partial [Funneliformis geosporum]